jgi:hypothetical protein
MAAHVGNSGAVAGDGSGASSVQPGEHGVQHSGEGGIQLVR